ncbi:MAG: repeat-containing protein [Planctomycetaceae bacterium]|nr:repeat-containing protein [Planctomycetaceae bacterium]
MLNFKSSLLIKSTLGLFLTFSAVTAFAAPLDQLPLDRWAKLREAERYQLQVAEKYYREQNWKVALSEYEKFMSLHEKSEGAPYAQLKWSQCQVQLRKLNTAVKDGFQSVMDYWPDSQEAIASSYFIGRAYKDMGEPKKAKQAYQNLIGKHKTHLAAVMARMDLLDIARIEGDQARRITLWRDLTYDIKRDNDSQAVCADASRQLAVHYFYTGSFDEGQKALATTYTPEQLPYHVIYYARGPVQELTASAETKPTGEKVADAGVAFMKSLIPADVSTAAAKTRARECWFYAADFEAAARRSEKVPQVYEQIIKTFGVDDEILGRLAAFYKADNRREEARKVYQKFQNAIEGQSQVAYSYREEQKWDPAIVIYRNLAAQDQKLPHRWKGEMAQTMRYAQKCDDAVTAYRQLMVEDSEKASQWAWEIGCTYRDFSRWQEAIKAFRETENFPEAYKQMAACHRQLKEFKEAISLYYQVIGSDPPSAPWALLQVGYTQEQAGEKEKAIRAFQQVCSKHSKTGQASEAHAYLQDKFKINATLGGDTADAEK